MKNDDIYSNNHGLWTVGAVPGAGLTLGIENTPGQPSVPDSTNYLINERGKTHGSFASNARVSQALKSALSSGSGFALLTAVQRESLDQICLKLSRIVSGNASFVDHWDDIAGYAKLANNPS